MNAPARANTSPGRYGKAELEELQLFLIGQFLAARPPGRSKPPRMSGAAAPKADSADFDHVDRGSRNIAERSLIYSRRTSLAFLSSRNAIKRLWRR
jgi:hypothetical protein